MTIVLCSAGLQASCRVDLQTHTLQTAGTKINLLSEFE